MYLKNMLTEQFMGYNPGTLKLQFEPRKQPLPSKSGI